MKGNILLPLDQSTTLSDGDRVCFGYERWYQYWAPLYSELYQVRTSVYGDNHPDLNSRVVRVIRKSDGLPFVSKTIPLKRERMAKIEIEAFNTIGYHPNTVQMVEEFFDATTLSYHIILEPEDMDLETRVCQARSANSSALSGQRTRIIAGLSKAVAHLHSLNLAYRDIKPQNILISVLGRGKITIKLCDFGIVRLNTRSVPKKWKAGTKHWMAPKSFRESPVDDRLVDCYAIGRILHFRLTASDWPEESQEAKRACGCPNPCQGPCVRRVKVFKTLAKAKAGKTCIDFLEKLLVGMPNQCMSITQVMDHSYVLHALRKLDS